MLVCGGRDFANRFYLELHLDAQLGLAECMGRRLPVRIVEGGASGADQMAREWAAARGVPCTTVEADWKMHGRGAGPIRNQKMLDMKPDLVIAFPGGNGTADMVRRAEKAGVTVVDLRAEPELRGAAGDTPESPSGEKQEAHNG